MEHFNAIAKGTIKNLGAGKTEKAIVRAGRAIGTISHVLWQFDEDNKVSRVSGVHRKAKYTKDVEMSLKSFSEHGYSHFQRYHANTTPFPTQRIFYTQKVKKKLKHG